MRILLFLVHLYLILYTSTAIITSGPSASVSITDYPSYAAAPPCVTSCVWGALRPGLIYSSDLAAAIGCGTQWAYNGCFCREDLASAADSFLGSCVPSKCASVTVLPGGAAAQVSSALGFYEGYCTKVRLEGAVATTASVVNSNGLSSSSRTSASTAQTTGATTPGGGSAPEATSIGDSSANGNKISKSDSIALGVGLGVGIPSLLIALVGLCINMKRRKRNREEPNLGNY